MIGGLKIEFSILAIKPTSLFDEVEYENGAALIAKEMSGREGI